MSYRYAGGKQTFYPKRVAQNGENGCGVHLANGRARSCSAGPRKGTAARDLLTEEQRIRVQSFVERFDASPGLEPALRLVAAEVQTFCSFQACKTVQRLTKRFGGELTPSDRRLAMLVARCGRTMASADGVSISRLLWGLGKLGLRDLPALQAAAERIPVILPDCGPISIATIWNGFEVLQFEPEACLEAMTEQVLARLDECDAPEVAIVLHAAAQLKFPARERLFAALIPHVRQHEDTFSLRHLAVCFHASARVGFRDEGLCKVVTRRFVCGFADTDTLALTSAVYACGLLAHVDQEFLHRAADFMERAITANGVGLSPQQVANNVYAFGKLGFCPPSALHAAANHAAERLHAYKDQELSNLTYGLGLLKFRNETFLNNLCKHITETRRAAGLDSQSIVSIVYGLALLGHCHHTALRTLGDHAIPKLLEFKPEEFSIMVYSFGILNFRHHDFLQAMVEHAPPVLPRFSTQNLSNLLHGLGLVSYDRDDDFIRLVASQLASRLHECSAQDIANPLTALMRLCIPHDQFLYAVAEFVTTPGSPLPLSKFTTQEIANTVYGFDALQVFDARLFEQTAIETERRLEEFIPQEVANIIWAFAKQSFGKFEWFERILARCIPHAEAPPRGSKGHVLATEWCAEDMEKPLGALWPVRDSIPSFVGLERVFRARFLGPIAAFLASVNPRDNRPAPAQYQKDFAAWDLYQVGPLFTEELFSVVGVNRIDPTPGAISMLLEHYVGEQVPEDEPQPLLLRYGEKMLLSVLPAARWLSSHVVYRLALTSDVDDTSIQGCEILSGTLVVEPAHPKDDEEANQRRFSASSWREPVELSCTGRRLYRPVLLSTFLGNWRHRHTELVGLDTVVNLALDAVAAAKPGWVWNGEDFWGRLVGEIDMFVPHTPCLSCVGAFAQLRQWAPGLKLRVAYEDWRQWRGRLFATEPAQRCLAQARR